MSRIQKLRKIFNKKTELFQKNKNSDNNSKKSDESEDNKPSHPRGNNKGRNGADKFKGAKTVYHPLLESISESPDLLN